jgi:hypothetical protein
MNHSRIAHNDTKESSMSKKFNAKTLPLLAFTALAITASFATSASACDIATNDGKPCLSGTENSGNQPQGTFINQTINTLTSEAQTLGYTGPTNNSSQANSNSGSNSGSSSGSRSYGDAKNDAQIGAITIDTTMKQALGQGDPLPSGGPNTLVINSDGNFDLAWRPGVGSGNGNVDGRIGNWLINNASVTSPHLANDPLADFRKADSRSGSASGTTTASTTTTVTATAAMLKKLGIGGRDPSRTTITTNSSGKVTAIVTDHRTIKTTTAPKMVSMVATTQHSGPITPPVASAPKLPQVPVALPSAKTIKAK